MPQGGQQILFDCVQLRQHKLAALWKEASRLSQGRARERRPGDQRASRALDTADRPRQRQSRGPGPQHPCPMVAPLGAFLKQAEPLVILLQREWPASPTFSAAPRTLPPIPAGPLGHAGNTRTELPGTPVCSQGPNPGFPAPGCVTLGRSPSLSGPVSQRQRLSLAREVGVRVKREETLLEPGTCLSGSHSRGPSFAQAPLWSAMLLAGIMTAIPSCPQA